MGRLEAPRKCTARGIQAIRDEVRAGNDANVVENLECIITGQCLPTAVALAIGPADFNTGHIHLPLSEWMQMPQEVKLVQRLSSPLLAFTHPLRLQGYTDRRGV